jgi:hypothetical protein
VAVYIVVSMEGYKAICRTNQGGEPCLLWKRFAKVSSQLHYLGIVWDVTLEGYTPLSSLLWGFYTTFCEG